MADFPSSPLYEKTSRRGTPSSSSAFMVTTPTRESSTVGGELGTTTSLPRQQQQTAATATSEHAISPSASAPSFLSSSKRLIPVNALNLHGIIGGAKQNLNRSTSTLTLGGGVGAGSPQSRALLGASVGGGSSFFMSPQQAVPSGGHATTTAPAAIDDEIAFIDAVFSRVFNNITLFKLKVMFNCDIPLSETEQTSVLEGKEVDPQRIAYLNETVRQVQDTILSKKKANIGLSQLTNMGTLFGGGGGTSVAGFGGVGAGAGTSQSEAGNLLTGRYTNRSDQSVAAPTNQQALVMGGLLAKSQQNKNNVSLSNVNLLSGGAAAGVSSHSNVGSSSHFGGEGQTDTDPTLHLGGSAGFTSSSFAPAATSMIISAGHGSLYQPNNNANANNHNKASAHGRRMSTIQHQIREQSAALSELTKNHIDAMFKYTLEDFVLRYQNHKIAEDARLAPRRLLDVAVGEQRENLDTAIVTIKKQEQLNFELSNKVKEMEVSIKTRDEIHKKRLDGFLREVCILKEQLFRSYRDKNYVGKPVDLMTAVEDTETGEDVSIDQLLEYRKQMKVSEKVVAEANAKVKRYEEELKDKEELMKRIQDRAKSKEASVANIKREMDKLNELALQQREELRILRADYAKLKGETAIDTANAGIQATNDRDDAIAHKFENSSVGKLAKNQNTSFLSVIVRLDEATTKIDDLSFENGTLKAQLETQREQIFSEFEEKIKNAEKERDEAIKVKEETLHRAANATRIASEAEEMIDVVKFRAAEEVIALAEELRTAQNAVHVLRLKAVAVTRAHLALATRYQILKNKNGLEDYKKKANSFHFARAEIAVRTAQANVAEVRRQCTREIEKATERVKAIENKSADANELLENQATKHYEEMRAVQQRVTAIENASRLLLADYEKLREEHFKLVMAQHGGGGGSSGSNNASNNKLLPLGGATENNGSNGLVDSPRNRSSRPGSSKGAATGGPLPRPSSSGVRKTAAPLPPPTGGSSATATNVGNNSFSTSTPSLPSLARGPAGATTTTTISIKNRKRIPLHEALERALDFVDDRERELQVTPEKIGDGEKKKTVEDVEDKALGSLTSSNLTVAYNPEKLKQFILAASYSGQGGQEGGAPKTPQEASEAFSELLNRTNDVGSITVKNLFSGGLSSSTASTQSSVPAAPSSLSTLPPLPDQVILASSTLQVEAALAVLAAQILLHIGKDATPASAIHLLTRGGTTSAAAATTTTYNNENGVEVGQNSSSPSSSVGIATVGSYGYTSANNLAEHVIMWAEQRARGKQKTAGDDGFSGSGLVAGATTREEGEVAVAHTPSPQEAALLAGLAAGSWSKLRTLMPAYHALKTTISKMSTINTECPLMKLPKLVPTPPSLASTQTLHVSLMSPSSFIEGQREEDKNGGIVMNSTGNASATTAAVVTGSGAKAAPKKGSMVIPPSSNIAGGGAVGKDGCNSGTVNNLQTPPHRASTVNAGGKGRQTTTTTTTTSDAISSQSTGNNVPQAKTKQPPAIFSSAPALKR